MPCLVEIASQLFYVGIYDLAYLLAVFHCHSNKMCDVTLSHIAVDYVKWNQRPARSCRAVFREWAISHARGLYRRWIPHGLDSGSRSWPIHWPTSDLDKCDMVRSGRPTTQT